MAAPEPIVNDAYELLKYLIIVLKKMPRDQKFLLGDRIQQQASDVLELLIEAIYTQKQLKKPLLLKVNITLEKLRHFVRLGYELGYYPSTRYQHIAKQIDKIGKQVGGWLKAL